MYSTYIGLSLVRPFPIHVGYSIQKSQKTATEGVSLAAAEVDQPLNLNESHGPVGRQDSTEWVQLHGSGVALHCQLKLTLLKESIALQGRGGEGSQLHSVVYVQTHLCLLKAKEVTERHLNT